VGIDQTHKDKSGKTARLYAIEKEKNIKDKQELVIMKNILALLSK
jgi:hypothetical protein